MTEGYAAKKFEIERLLASVEVEKDFDPMIASSSVGARIAEELFRHFLKDPTVTLSMSMPTFADLTVIKSRLGEKVRRAWPDKGLSILKPKDTNEQRVYFTLIARKGEKP